MEKLKQVQSMKELLQDDFSDRLAEVADYLNRRLCPVEKARLFFYRARNGVSALTGEGEANLIRMHNLTAIMLRKLGELHPEYQFQDEDIEAICNAALFHDIGKFLLPQEILNKPDKLLPEEAAVIHKHTEFGYEIVRRILGIAASPHARYFYEICRYHHERWDGNGYPFGLSGEQIPVYVQIVSIVDVYDALISRRDYKPTYSHMAAIEMIESGECGVFNPEILECFRQVSEQLRLEAEHYKTTANYKQVWLYRALKRLNVTISIGLVAIVLALGVNIGFFAVNLQKTVRNDKLNQLASFTRNAASVWNEKMKGDIGILQTEGVRLKNAEIPGSSVFEDEERKKVAEVRNYRFYGVFYRNGTIVANGGEDSLFGETFETLNEQVSNWTSVKQPECYIEPCWLPQKDMPRDPSDTNGFYIAVPVFKGLEIRDNVFAFVVCAYLSTDIVEILNFDDFGGVGYAHIFLADGTYIVKPDFAQTNNFYDLIQRFEFRDGTNAASLQAKIYEGVEGFVHYDTAGKGIYANYASLNSNKTDAEIIDGTRDWRVFMSVRDDVITGYIDSIQRTSILFYLLIGVCLISLVILVSLKLSQVLRITKEMAVQYDDIRQDLEMSESKYKTILAQTKHMVFEFDHTTNVVTHTEATAARYGFPMVYKYSPENPVIKDRIHPDDYEAYQKIYHDILSGKETAEANLRLKLTSGEYIWNRCIMHNIYDDEKRAVKAIGFAEDVNSILKETQHLRDSAMRDPFTGIYNKTYTEILINKELAVLDETPRDEEMKHAFIIMDIDNFKNINDTYGHATGDLILKNLAGMLSRNSRGYDLVGRIGGDEFVFFMQDIRDESAAITKAKTLIELSHGIGGSRIACSISIGIAFSPADGRTYQELYEHGDQALYVSKKNGGDTWSAF